MRQDRFTVMSQEAFQAAQSKAEEKGKEYNENGRRLGRLLLYGIGIETN